MPGCIPIASRGLSPASVRTRIHPFLRRPGGFRLSGSLPARLRWACGAGGLFPQYLSFSGGTAAPVLKDPHFLGPLPIVVEGLPALS